MNEALQAADAAWRLETDYVTKTIDNMMVMMMMMIRRHGWLGL